MKGDKFSNVNIKGGEGPSHQSPYLKMFHATFVGVHLPKSYPKI